MLPAFVTNVPSTTKFCYIDGLPFVECLLVDRFPTLLIIINAVGIPGRMISASLAAFGAVKVFIPKILSATLCLYMWPQVHTLTAGFIWISSFGYFGAVIQSLFPSCCVSLTPFLSKSGIRIGMIVTIISFAA